jgi:hypothetical protein
MRMDGTTDLETALSFVVRRIEQQAKASGHPLNEDEHSVLENLPPSQIHYWAAPELGPPELVPRDINVERLCALAKGAYLHDSKINPESLDWEFAFTVFRLNRHRMWGVLNAAGVKTCRRPLLDHFFVIITALVPLFALTLLVANGTRNAFGWAGILSGGLAMMLLLYFASREIERWQLENYIERCRLASRNIK